jgi:hypothetical protein
MDVGIWLQKLNAAAVTMHVAKAAYVHQDVKTQTVARAKCPQKFVMSPAMLRT